MWCKCSLVVVARHSVFKKITKFFGCGKANNKTLSLFVVVVFQALREGRQPDYSDYKDFKLTCENIGYQMMLKLGWKEGEGLGTEGQGITQPVNK